MRNREKKKKEEGEEGCGELEVATSTTRITQAPEKFASF